jgi:hypothetical protein
MKKAPNRFIDFRLAELQLILPYTRERARVGPESGVIGNAASKPINFMFPKPNQMG